MGRIENGHKLVRRIRKGYFGEVWEGESPAGKPVALKSIDATTAMRRETWEREIRTPPKHKNVVKVVDSWKGHDEHGQPQLWIAMELCGEDLYDHICSGPLAIDEFVDISRQICSALEAAHKLGRVHRDIKPRNVMRSRKDDGVWKVGDWGRGGSSKRNQSTLLKPPCHSITLRQSGSDVT